MTEMKYIYNTCVHIYLIVLDNKLHTYIQDLRITYYYYYYCYNHYLNITL